MLTLSLLSFADSVRMLELLNVEEDFISHLKKGKKRIRLVKIHKVYISLSFISRYGL